MFTRRTVFLVALTLAVGCNSNEPADDPKGTPERAADRTFEVRYTAKVEAIPRNEQLRLWIPVPSDDEYQKVSPLKVHVEWEGAKHSWKEVTHPETKNRVVYLEGRGPAGTAEVVIDYTVERRTRTVDQADLASDGAADPKTGRVAWGLASVERIVVDERIKKESAELAPAGTPTLKVGRAFYDHVAKRMAYDKSGVGWGLGDSRFACREGRGNCTDFHAYFMALCKARGIPSQFEIGLFGPYDATKGEAVELGGYHCWAEFRVPGKAWVPVDISEGDKNPARYEACFGELTANRVTLSRGRDLTLAPAQAGPKLNYHVDPYAEVGGKPHQATKRATWRDLP